MIGLDLQESPPLSSCFVLRAKSGESDGGQYRGGWRGGGRSGGGVESSAQRGKTSRGLLLHPCSDHVNHKGVCVCIGERHTESEKEKQGPEYFHPVPHSKGISIAGGLAQPPSGGLDGQITFAIYKPPKLCLDKPSKSQAMAKRNVRRTFVFNRRDLGKGESHAEFPQNHKENTSAGNT